MRKFFPEKLGGRQGGTSPRDDGLARALVSSPLFRDYARGITALLSLPLSLHAPARNGSPRFAQNGNFFCGLLSKTSGGCGQCMAFQQKPDRNQPAPAPSPCPAGLGEIIVPVHHCGRLIASLHIGRVRLQPARKGDFQRLAKQFAPLAADLDLQKAEAAWLRTPILTPAQSAAVLSMLTIFAAHLSLHAAQLMRRSPPREPETITRARGHIAAHFTEELPMPAVARAVGMSANHFSEKFKQSTGLDFTRYLARARIDHALELLLDPHRRISEIAFASGFQSLSQFNRTFKKLTGHSPSEHRAALAGSMPAIG